LDRLRRAVFTTGGPGFGFEHFKSHDFLREGEVVLTFDDGPWPKNTPAVLAALAAHCTKAIFFPIGLHATYEPGILKQVAAAGQGSLARSVGRRRRPRVYCASPTERFTSKMDA
jgi:peptidoglycan/xylan/chitin deacetylase (PgdA/CDA1 family)